MNQRSSAMTARRKTRLVVRRGRAWFAREKLREGGAKRESVPVPVLGGELLVWVLAKGAEREEIPVRTDFAFCQDAPD